MPADPHDRFFKRVFAHPEHVVAPLRLFLPPDLLDALDAESLELAPGSYVDPELEVRESDLLFRCRIAGEPALLYLLFEHQSTPDPLMAVRLHG